jgi:CDGSH-type Zn-finger protein
MARQIRHDASGPAVLDEDDLGDDGKLYVCRCGLSNDQPLCDGSHDATADEDDDVVYEYEDDDPDGERWVVEGVELAEEEVGSTRRGGGRVDSPRSGPGRTDDE